ncbi:MAG TPA: hypothetical protein V6C86_10520 [Oculatellaceae cyanobacterium]
MISQAIRQHITRLGRTEPFTTKDFLIYGNRASVDQTLSRLVKIGFIVRLAPGVFARESGKEYTNLDIKTAKVRSKVLKAIARFEEKFDDNLELPRPIEEMNDDKVDALNACVNEFRRLSSNLHTLISQPS